MHKTCVILGGMGPLSGADLSKKLVEEMERRGAARDQDHLRHIILTDPHVPDRTTALLRGGEDFVPAIVAQTKVAQQCGGDFIAIACNTAHARFEEIQAQSPLPILHMIRETAEEIATKHPGVVIGVLGTEGTLKLNLYGSVLEAAGIPVVATPPEALAASQNAIYLMKSGAREDALDQALAAVDLMRAEGAQAITLGCTELPIILDEALARAKRTDIAIIDPTRVLARAIIRDSLR